MMEYKGEPLDATTVTADQVKIALARGNGTKEEAIGLLDRALWLLDSRMKVLIVARNKDFAGQEQHEEEYKSVSLRLVDLFMLQRELQDPNPRSPFHLQSEGPAPALPPDPVPPPSGAKINVRGGLKELASMLLKLESENTIDHVTDKDAAVLFTVRGSPVNPESLKNVRSRDL
jgi:hypothetical protein